MAVPVNRVERAMTCSGQWLLPEGMEEMLPDRAQGLETLRRSLLDVLERRGFALVLPPLVEFLEALLTGVGEDLDLQTAKLTDAVSGRLLGVRADHTPQIARIDAHYLRHEAPSRLCYCGPVLRSSPGAIEASREPLQIGAELFGCAEVDADAEIVEAMVDVLQAAGVPDIHLHLGHVGVYRALARWAALPDAVETTLFDALQRQSRPDVAAILADHPGQREAFVALLTLRGGEQTIRDAQMAYQGVPGVDAVVASLLELMRRLRRTLPEVPMSIDLSDLRGYRYHNGAVFNAYTPGYGRALAQGGRYDEIGRSFGRARSATGFSADLRRLLRYSDGRPPAAAILAPGDEDPALDAAIRELRERGERVIRLLAGESPEVLAARCDRRLVQADGDWRVEPLAG